MAGLESSTLLTCHEGAAHFDDLFVRYGKSRRARKFSSKTLVAATSYTRTDEQPLTTILSSTLGGGRKAGNFQATHAGVAGEHIALRNSASVDRASLLLAHKTNAAQMRGPANKKLSVTMMGNTYKSVVGILEIMDGAVEAGIQARSLLPYDYCTPQMPPLTVEELLTDMVQLKRDGRISDLTFGGGTPSGRMEGACSCVYSCLLMNPELSLGAMSHVSYAMSHVFYGMSYVSYAMSYVSYAMSYVPYAMSHVILCIPVS
jgi:hypothetical protein